jgi:hypothetical protein
MPWSIAKASSAKARSIETGRTRLHSRPHAAAAPTTFHLFCDDENLSLCVRGHSFRCGGVDMMDFCFAERTHAEQFRGRFGGEFIDAKSRPKWRGSQRR